MMKIIIKESQFTRLVENQNYIGDIPNMNYYGTNKMSKDELDKFKLWYNAERNSVNKKEY